MKNKIGDVRNHLCSMLERLDNDDLTPEQLASEVERAKAVTMVAGAYIGAVKIEIDAIRLMDETGRLPVAVEAGPQMRLIGGREAA